MTLRRYQKKTNQPVRAIQLKLDTPGFSYTKWQSQQHCKSGDWLVDNAGDVYTVNQSVFENTYQLVQPGNYIKITPVWAEQTIADGTIDTLEGKTHYQAGDYLVYNNADQTDGYAVEKEKFETMYQLLGAK